MTLGLIPPNYGSFFGIAEVNHNDLPVPYAWVAYAARHLDPQVDPIMLSPSSPAALLAYLPAYAAIGTRFVVAPADAPLPGLTLRYADRAMRIYDVPGPVRISAPQIAPSRRPPGPLWTRRARGRAG